MAALSALSPGALPTTVDRVASVVQYRSDNALLAREVESRAVIGAIRRHPLTGSGFGATLTWGKTDVFATTTTSFTHDGYLWLAWKLGIPLAFLIVAAVAAVALRRGRPPQGSALVTLRIGSQSALIALLLVCVTFPAFNALGITAVMGLMVAVCLSRARA